LVIQNFLGTLDTEYSKGVLMLRSKFLGIGGALGATKVTNHDLEKLIDTSDEWVQQRTGIQQRYWATPEQSTSDIALEASLKAITNAGIKKEDIDLIILATCSPDSDIPGCAAFLQAKLEIPGIPFYDIRQACSGFLYGINLADMSIRMGQAKCVLVVGAEVHSKGLDKTPNGRTITSIFGDGAGAVIMGPTQVKDPNKDAHLMHVEIHADGSFAKELWMPSPGSGNGVDRINASHIEQGLIYPSMNGRTVFSHATTRMPEVLNSVCTKTNTALSDIDLFFFHQANLRINSKVAEDMGIPMNKVHSTIQKFGNTTAATIPLGMFDALEAGLLKPGMLIGASAFGAGFTWGAALWRT
jgi:3-oxoacyl-[acyl-carrier-protein] synthase-3